MSFEEMKKRTCIAFVKILYSPETDRDTSLSWSQVHNNDKNNDIINVAKKEKKDKTTTSHNRRDVTPRLQESPPPANSADVRSTEKRPSEMEKHRHRRQLGR